MADLLAVPQAFGALWLTISLGGMLGERSGDFAGQPACLHVMGSAWLCLRGRQPESQPH